MSVPPLLRRAPLGLRPERWWAERSRTSDLVADVAEGFRDAVRDGLTDLPLPGQGCTAERWAALAGWGATELSLARLVEGHTDAVAILAELGGPTLPHDCSSAVWAAEPPTAQVVARSTPAADDARSWRLDGTKAWCSGASHCDTALLTTTADDGPRLMLVELTDAGVRPCPSEWSTVGMAASDTVAVEFADVPATTVGPVNGYLDRPGFWVGGIGVAAVWWGGARAVAAPLRRAAATGRAGAHALAHLGRVRALLAATGALLEHAADAVDAAPTADHEALALTVRGAVADAADEVLQRVGRALGPGPLAEDAGHAQRVADLTVYLRQDHAERDRAHLGELEDADAW